MIISNGKKSIAVVRTVTVANYDDLTNRPIINSDLDATSATEVTQNQLYRHNGESEDNYKIGMLYFSDGTSWVTFYLDLQTIYPIGSIYMSVNSTSPASLFGGTWEQIAKGRALFGAGEIEPDGSVPSEGSTTKITYNVGEVNAGLPNIQGWGLRGGQDGWTPDGEGNAFKLTSSGNSNGNSGNYGGNYSFDASRSNELYGKSTTVQPNAFVCYIWKRIA